VLGSGFSGVSSASFSGYAFLMSSLETDLCSSTGSIMTRVSLWWRSMTAFSRYMIHLASVWVFIYFSIHSLPL
jgi:hypothetical protein